MGTADGGARQPGRGPYRRAWGSDAADWATNIPLARGTNMSGNIPLQAGADVAMVQIRGQPRWLLGLAPHPGGAIIVVQTGTLTVYRSLGSQCQHTTYSAGQAFIERPGEVNNVINTGTVPYVLFVTFPRCLGAPPRELTSRIPVPARGSDDLTERDVPALGVAVRVMCSVPNQLQYETVGTTEKRHWPFHRRSPRHVWCRVA